MAQKKTALQTLELQLREAQLLAHFGSWEWDLRANVVTWSEALYQMMGVDPATFKPSLEGFLSCVHPEDRERVARAADANRRAGTPYAEPIRIVRPDGTVRTIRGGSHAVSDAAGRPVRVVGVLQDISEETQAQEALRSYAEQVVVLARRLVEVQEVQGRRLARELHDNLGPSLTALGINLQLIEDALPAALRQGLAGRLSDSRQQVQAASAAMRTSWANCARTASTTTACRRRCASSLPRSRSAPGFVSRCRPAGRSARATASRCRSTASRRRRSTASPSTRMRGAWRSAAAPGATCSRSRTTASAWARARRRPTPRVHRAGACSPCGSAQPQWALPAKSCHIPGAASWCGSPSAPGRDTVRSAGFQAKANTPSLPVKSGSSGSRFLP